MLRQVVCTLGRLQPLSTRMRYRSWSHTTSVVGSSKGKLGIVPSELDQSTGLAREEYLQEREGKELYDLDRHPRDFYGTVDMPQIVRSYENSRIVGCSGYPMENHDYSWFEVHKDKPQRCLECGQVFLLEMVHPPTHIHSHGQQHQHELDHE